MTLDQGLWEQLELHGLTPAHMEMLLRLLEVQKNGQWTWHIVHGQLSQCDLRVSFSSRGYDVARVSETLLGGESVLR